MILRHDCVSPVLNFACLPMLVRIDVQIVDDASPQILDQVVEYIPQVTSRRASLNESSVKLKGKCREAQC